MPDECMPVPDSTHHLQPQYYKHFHCLADACPDTCCEGWRVGIDKGTYEKYRQSSDAVLKPSFQQFITINDARMSDDQYAVFATFEGRCSFLSEGLCSIQRRLGEAYLGAACASFPRVTNLIHGVLERSLDLSCPEAARLALLDPAPLRFDVEYQPADEATGNVAHPSHGLIWNRAFLDAPYPDTAPSGDQLVAAVRNYVRTLLQDRRYSIPNRLLLLGHFCTKLNDIAIEQNYQATWDAMEGFRCAIDGGLFDEHLGSSNANPATQLGIVLDLIVERVKSDFTHRRFLELYGQFLNGLQLTPDLTLQQMGMHYQQAYRQHYLPLISQHEYVLEHYLVNNAYKALFPFGSKGFSRALKMDSPRAITSQYMLLTSYFAIMKALLIGVAAHQGASFDLAAVVRTVQICSKTFEHSVAFPKRVLEILATCGVTSPAGMSVLTQN